MVTTTKKPGAMVVCKEAIVINVGARPPVYPQVTVVDRRTGDRVQIPADNPEDPGDEGVPYAFKEGQKVRASHPAVEACPGAFVSVDEAEESGLIESK